MTERKPPVRKTTGKVGGPSWIPSDKDLETVMKMIGEGQSVRDICKRLKVSPDTFYRKIKSTEQEMIDSSGRNRLEEAISTARNVLGDRISNTILQVALDPTHKNHMRAAEWYWSKVLKLDEPEQPNIVVIQSPNEPTDPKSVANALREARRKDLKEYKDDGESNK